MPGLVVHNAQLAAERESRIAEADYRRHRPMGGGLVIPKNSRWERAGKVSGLMAHVAHVENIRREESKEALKPYNRKKDYYDALGLDRQCSAAEIRRAFRRLSLKYHPDKQARRVAPRARVAAPPSAPSRRVACLARRLARARRSASLPS